VDDNTKFFIKRAIALVFSDTENDQEVGELSYVAVTNRDFKTSIPMLERDITYQGNSRGKIALYGFKPEALGDMPIETDRDTLLQIMTDDEDELLPAEWFRICEYVALFP